MNSTLLPSNIMELLSLLFSLDVAFVYEGFYLSWIICVVSTYHCSLKFEDFDFMDGKLTHKRAGHN